MMTSADRFVLLYRTPSSADSRTAAARQRRGYNVKNNTNDVALDECMHSVSVWRATPACVSEPANAELDLVWLGHSELIEEAGGGVGVDALEQWRAWRGTAAARLGWRQMHGRVRWR